MLKKYGLVVMCLLSFVLQCFEGWESNYTMKLTSVQETACGNLLATITAALNASNDLSLPTDGDMDSDVVLDSSDVEDLEDKEYEDLEENEQESIQVAENEQEGIQVQPGVLESPVQCHILELLVSLFTHLSSGMDNKFYTPIS